LAKNNIYIYINLPVCSGGIDYHHCKIPRRNIEVVEEPYLTMMGSTKKSLLKLMLKLLLKTEEDDVEDKFEIQDGG